MLNANRLKVKSGPVTSKLQASLSATVAQLVEHLLCDCEIVGSNHDLVITKTFEKWFWLLFRINP